MKGVTGIKITVREYAYGVFEVKNVWDGEALAKIKVEYANVWETYEEKFSMPDGVQALYLTYRGSGNASLLSFELLC